MEEIGWSLPEGTLVVLFPRALSGTEEVSLNIHSPRHVFTPTQRRKITQQPPAVKVTDGLAFGRGGLATFTAPTLSLQHGGRIKSAPWSTAFGQAAWEATQRGL